MLNGLKRVHDMVVQERKIAMVNGILNSSFSINWSGCVLGVESGQFN